MHAGRNLDAGDLEKGSEGWRGRTRREKMGVGETYTDTFLRNPHGKLTSPSTINGPGRETHTHTNTQSYPMPSRLQKKVNLTISLITRLKVI